MKLKELTLDENSDIYKLFHFPFYCKIPRFATFSYETIEKYGTYYSAEGELAAYQKEWKLMTINDMIEYYKEGIVIELVDAKDAEKIYNIIVGHLIMWRDYGIYYGHPYEPPMEDLKYLDEFSELLHVKAYYYGTDIVKEMDYIDTLSSLPADTIRTVYERENLFEQILHIKEELGENPYHEY